MAGVVAQPETVLDAGAQLSPPKFGLRLERESRIETQRPQMRTGPAHHKRALGDADRLDADVLSDCAQRRAALFWPVAPRHLRLCRPEHDRSGPFEEIFVSRFEVGCDEARARGPLDPSAPLPFRQERHAEGVPIPPTRL